MERRVIKTILIEVDDIHPDDFDPEEMVSVEDIIYSELRKLGWDNAKVDVLSTKEPPTLGDKLRDDFIKAWKCR